MSKTREQRKRERWQTAAMAAALMIMWMVICTMMVKAWADSPAEQPVNGVEYIESIGGDPDVIS